MEYTNLNDIYNRRGMKSSSIVMTVGGGFNTFVFGFIVLGGLAMGVPEALARMPLHLLCLAAGGVQLAAGITGLASKGKKGRLRACVGLGIAAAVLLLVSGVWQQTVQPSGESYYLLASLLLPGLYVVTAFAGLRPTRPVHVPAAGTVDYGPRPEYASCERDRQGRPILTTIVGYRFCYWILGVAMLALGLFVPVYNIIGFGFTASFSGAMNDLIVPFILTVGGILLIRRALIRWTLTDEGLIKRGMLGSRFYAFEELRACAVKTPPQMWGGIRGVRYATGKGHMRIVFFYCKTGGEFMRAVAKASGIALPAAFYTIPPNKIGTGNP